MTFGDATAANTPARFSQSGVYVLRLTANDGALSASDEVTIAMQPSPDTDLNGDGRADLVWRHTTTGAVAFWLQDGFRILDACVLATVPLEWQVVGMGDLNGDGRTDLVWRHTTTGAVAFWLQDGFGILDARVLETVPLEWQIVGVADVNGDGRADLVWHNTTTGAVAFWLQDGFGILDARVLETVPLEWQIVGVADVNGDGRADLVWHNTITGAVAFWLQDGFGILDAHVLATVPVEWSIVQGEWSGASSRGNSVLMDGAACRSGASRRGSAGQGRDHRAILFRARAGGRAHPGL